MSELNRVTNDPRRTDPSIIPGAVNGASVNWIRGPLNGSVKFTRVNGYDNDAVTP